MTQHWGGFWTHPMVASQFSVSQNNFPKARLLPLLFSDTSEGRGAHLVSMQCMVPKPIAAQEDICLEL